MVIDLIGPISLKEFTNTRKTRKAWILIGSCCYSRAIVGYLVESLSPESFLMSWNTHTAQRGMCAHLFCDCGSNFTSNLAREFFAKYAGNIQSRLAIKKTQLHIGAGNSPHQQGSCERLNSTFKDSLHVAVGKRVVSVRSNLIY